MKRDRSKKRPRIQSIGHYAKGKVRFRGAGQVSKQVKRHSLDGRPRRGGSKVKTIGKSHNNLSLWKNDGTSNSSGTEHTTETEQR